MKFLALTLLVVIFFCLGFTWGTVESIGYIKAKCDNRNRNKPITAIGNRNRNRNKPITAIGKCINNSKTHKILMMKYHFK